MDEVDDQFINDILDVINKGKVEEHTLNLTATESYRRIQQLVDDYLSTKDPRNERRSDLLNIARARINHECSSKKYRPERNGFMSQILKDIFDMPFQIDMSLSNYLDELFGLLLMKNTGYYFLGRLAYQHCRRAQPEAQWAMAVAAAPTAYSHHALRGRECSTLRVPCTNPLLGCA